MFGIGSTELLVIILVALVVLGPKSLTGITRSLGKAVGEFRRVSTEFQRTLNTEVDQAAEDDRKKAAEAAPVRTAQESGRTAAGAQSPAPQTTQVQAAATQPAAPQDARDAMPSFDAVPQPPAPPADSPLAQALAKTRAEAEGAPASSNGKPTGGAA
ncbi:MAG: twin-arginine translocase TatA/TatE family subunit [Desulfovibrio sp.]|uniref:twin-arginine translocase TatA/TatE family subunit n=1 Tax=Desulfovibrio sp. TaxID=885 RepID=UPI0025BF6569|nr:twin-arginine translocase TatA/TatE family subunit [Desulfovibrio sp.]MCI7569204.1 twin-arginine translocase TatA/TatE family subunit [Desulfovibrio sp.]